MIAQPSAANFFSITILTQIIQHTCCDVEKFLAPCWAAILNTRDSILMLLLIKDEKSESKVDRQAGRQQ